MTQIGSSVSMRAAQLHGGPADGEKLLMAVPLPPWTMFFSGSVFVSSNGRSGLYRYNLRSDGNYEFEEPRVTSASA